MKIEMGESLALSYLKHVKRCVFYQTNWKSSSRWDGFNEEMVLDIFGKVKTNPELKCAIPSSSGLEQFLKQAEIDVLGMDQKGKIYVIDIAYHENGLNYKGKDNTRVRVMKKSLRSYLALLTYFPDRQYEIIFASPKVGPAKNGLILAALEELKKIVSNDGKVKFEYLSNEDFGKEILHKTIEENASDSDTGELFLRAYKLFEGAKKKRTKRSSQDEPAKDFLELIPSDEALFKQKLIETKQAKRTWFYNDGGQVSDTWVANGFTEESNLRSDIFSNNKVREREDRGICKLRIEIC